MNIDEDPLFIEAGEGNYRLKKGSPCTDTGDNSTVECDLFDIDNDDEDCTSGTVGDNPDLDLNDRIGDGTVDMGAYEFETCIWDLDGDCEVNTIDLLFLFGNLGSCADCNDCPADFNGDCTVNTSDLLAIFANWGPCYCAEIGIIVLSFEDELDDACISEAEWDDYEDIMANGTAAEKENYQCWLLHWIEDCDRCTCSGESGCPDDDPFGE